MRTHRKRRSLCARKTATAAPANCASRRCASNGIARRRRSPLAMRTRAAPCRRMSNGARTLLPSAFGMYCVSVCTRAHTCVGGRIDARKPDVYLSTEACVTSLQWHPSRPALLAVGAHSGVVSVYDISRRSNDMLVATVSAHTYGWVINYNFVRRLIRRRQPTAAVAPPPTPHQTQKSPITIVLRAVDGRARTRSLRRHWTARCLYGACLPKAHNSWPNKQCACRSRRCRVRCAPAITMHADQAV